MGRDEQTLDFYTREAARYADFTAGDVDHPMLPRFAAMLPAGGDVLDFGCGPGWAAGRFAELGFRVRALDGSEGLAAEARRRYGVEVDVCRFEDFDEVGAYDGIWASFCLLHDTRAAMPGHLARLCRGLRPGGAIYIGLKEGEGESRDSLGRYYTYFREDEMRELMGAAGFVAIDAVTEASTGLDGMPAVSMYLFARRG